MILLNPTRKQLNKEAIKNSLIKQTIAEKFIRDLNVIFRRILKDLRIAYTRIGIIPEQSIYFDRIRDIINKYQIDTANIFSGRIRDDEYKSINFYERKQNNLIADETENENIEEAIALLMLAWIDENSENQTKIIIETNEKEILQSIKKSKEELGKGDKIYGNTEIISLALIGLKNKFINRSVLIADQNVSSAAHEAMVTEAEQLNTSSAVIEDQPIMSLVFKTWNAILDSKTRQAHANADFKYMADPISPHEKFIVMGEELKYPRDPNGSNANIQGCRCEVQIVAKT